MEKERIYLNLTHNDGTKLFLKPSSFVSLANELEDFLEGEKHLATKTFAKKVMFSHEIKANNQVEGYGDDIFLIKEVIKKAEGIKDSEQRQRILNLYHGYNYILKGNDINPDTLKKLYSLLSKDLLIESDAVRMGEYYRTAPVYILKGGRLDLEPDQGVDASRIEEFISKYFEFLNTNFDGSMTDEYIKSQILHYYFVYIHPYFDVNGRTSRTLAMWYLLNNKCYPYIIFNRGIGFQGRDYDRVIEDVKKFNDLSFFISYMLRTVKIELEKEYIMQVVASYASEKLDATDYQTLLYFLSMNGLKTVMDFSSIYNRFNDKKRVRVIFDTMIKPLLDKGIFDIERPTNKLMYNDNVNLVLKLKPSLDGIDRNKVKNVNLFI
ncbi:MAG: Fic family protein [Clostridia bacterium]